LGAPHPEQSPEEARAEEVGVCQATGVTIPECSCSACVGELIRLHAPAQADGLPESPRAA